MYVRAHVRGVGGTPRHVEGPFGGRRTSPVHLVGTHKADELQLHDFLGRRVELDVLLAMGARAERLVGEVKSALWERVVVNKDFADAWAKLVEYSTDDETDVHEPLRLLASASLARTAAVSWYWFSQR